MPCHLIEILVILSLLSSCLSLTSEVMIKRDSFTIVEVSAPSTQLEVMIALKQNNLDLIESTLHERGDPAHPLYQQWLTMEEVLAITRNDAAFEAVTGWLSVNEIEVTWISQRRHVLVAVAMVAQWELLLNTTFYVWKDTSKGAPELFDRAESYRLPPSLDPFVTAVLNVCDPPPVFGPQRRSRPAAVVQEESGRSHPLRTETNEMTVAFLNSLYGIPSNLASTSLGQAVFETSSESFEQSDLTEFQQTFDLTVQAAEVVGTTASTSGCSTATCGEGSLDIQYIMGIAQGPASTFWYSSSFYSFLVAVGDTSDPPTVLSISWGSYEYQQSSSTLTQFNTEAMQLSVMGITIFASTGDDGVSGFDCLCTQSSSKSTTQWTGSNTWTGVGYFPQFPASSPYVVAVGATQGPEAGLSEYTCSSNTSGVITSGGGFSDFFPQPSYQSAHVATYLPAAASEGHTPPPGYNVQGRAYPDISFVGVLYPVYVAGVLYDFFGTSCSSPLAAAITTLVNSKRLAAGLATVGYIHPTLYQSSNSGLYRDVTIGNNRCCAQTTSSPPVCCASGFYAAPGWDPATGLGSITFENLASMFSVGTAKAPTSKPSLTPLHSPTAVPVHSPTAAPVHFPTAVPVHSPTAVPIHSPTAVPIHFPTAVPIHSPTAAPVHSPTAVPVHSPTAVPIHSPTAAPVHSPTAVPVHSPTAVPIHFPTVAPVHLPSVAPVSKAAPVGIPGIPGLPPVKGKSTAPVPMPSAAPLHPSAQPTSSPTVVMLSPSKLPTLLPTLSPATDAPLGAENQENASSSGAMSMPMIAGVIVGVILLVLAVVAVLCIRQLRSNGSSAKITARDVSVKYPAAHRGNVSVAFEVRNPIMTAHERETIDEPQVEAPKVSYHPPPVTLPPSNPSSSWLDEEGM